MLEQNREELEKEYEKLKSSVGYFSKAISIGSIILCPFFLWMLLGMVLVPRWDIGEKIFIWIYIFSYLFCIFNYFVYAGISSEIMGALKRNDLIGTQEKCKKLKKYKYVLGFFVLIAQPWIILFLLSPFFLLISLLTFGC